MQSELTAPAAAHLASERRANEEVIELETRRITAEGSGTRDGEDHEQGLSHGEAGPSNGPTDKPAHANARLSPILAKNAQVEVRDGQPKSPNPEFAEFLTPAKLRRRRRHIPRVILPPSVAGPSREGWQTGEDVYRGASVDPTVSVPAPGALVVDDDAVTLGGSSTSSSSSGTGSTWSIVSDLERGRRRTVAAIERFGERIGVRRPSASESEHSVGSMLERQMELQHQNRSRRRSISRLSRTLTRRSSIDSTQSAPRRQHIPRRRQFTLTAEGETTTTPTLTKVLEQIQTLRIQAGFDTPTRGGSLPGKKRTAAIRKAASFVPPPVPARALTRQNTQSRLTALRFGAGVSPLPSPALSPIGTPGIGAKPLTPAQIMGLTSPASAPNLASMREFPSTPIEVGPSGPPTPALAPKASSCWWLDVGCPTWEDLRDIGELLGMHPLTLEDVLQQDPREKMDLFDSLGYYFIVVRALDETYFKYTPGSSSLTSIGKSAAGGNANGKDGGAAMDEKAGDEQKDGQSPDLAAQNEKKREGRRRGWGMGRAVGKLAGRQGEKVEIVEDNPGREGLEGVGVGAVNVYMAVFADGIVTFHFDDISKHTSRVRERILSGVAEYTSDGVAHGVLDSVVDAFFPLIRYVDGEVDDIDSLTIDPTVDPRTQARSRQGGDSATSVSSDSPQASPAGFAHSNPHQPHPPQLDPHDSQDSSFNEQSEKHPYPPPTPKISARQQLQMRSTGLKRKIRSCLPAIHIDIPRHYWGLLYIKLFFLPVTSAVRQFPRPIEPVFDRNELLKRIVQLRRIVTGMTRLLGTKNQVVGKLRKRLEDSNSLEGAYVGDVEDHILLLQTSLYHYEYILSHCQPAYISHLKWSYHITRRLISKHILILSVVAVTILPFQFVTGLFSINVEVPQDGIGQEQHINADGSPAGYTWFGRIIGILFAVLCILCFFVRYLKWESRRKYEGRRGKELPTYWEGYWGWK